MASATRPCARMNGMEPDSLPRGKVLVVDDEPTIVEVVGRYLERAGYEVITADDGPHALAAAIEHRPDLIVLDLMLPEIGGMEVMRTLREQAGGTHATGGGAGGDGPAAPAVILLTAKSEETDRLVGLRQGADDYIVKPFSPAELVARVESVLRRAAPAPERTAAVPITRGELAIDPGRRTVTLGAEEISLTQLEFDLLAYLAAHPGQVFSRDQLIEAVWRQPAFKDTGTVTVHIRRLRAKLEADPAAPEYLETVWGVGYRFRS